MDVDSRLQSVEEKLRVLDSELHIRNQKRTRYNVPSQQTEVKKEPVIHQSRLNRLKEKDYEKETSSRDERRSTKHRISSYRSKRDENTRKVIETKLDDRTLPQNQFSVRFPAQHDDRFRFNYGKSFRKEFWETESKNNESEVKVSVSSSVVVKDRKEKKENPNIPTERNSNEMIRRQTRKNEVDEDNIEEEQTIEKEESIEKEDVNSKSASTRRQSRMELVRDKRMFGLLMGTLQTFKKESEVKSEKEIQREIILKKITEDEIKEKEEARLKRIELHRKRRELRDQIRVLNRTKQMTIIRETKKEYYKTLSFFIELNTKPKIFFLPAKHNENTKNALERTQKVYEEMCQQLDIENKEMESEALKSVYDVDIQEQMKSNSIDEEHLMEDSIDGMKESGETFSDEENQDDTAI